MHSHYNILSECFAVICAKRVAVFLAGLKVVSTEANSPTWIIKTFSIPGIKLLL